MVQPRRPTRKQTVLRTPRHQHQTHSFAAAGGLTVWNATSGTAVEQLSGHAADINELAFTASGKQLVSADAGGTVIVWDLATGRVQQRISAGGGAATVAVSADARTLYTVDQDGTLASWDLTGTRGFNTTAPVPAQSDPPTDAAAFSRNGRRLVLALKDQLVVCDGATLGVQRTVPLPGPGLAVAVDPSGRRAVVSTATGLTLVDLATGAALAHARLSNPTSSRGVNTIAWSPRADRIALADPARTRLLLLDPATLTIQRQVPLPDSPGQVAFSPDGQLVAVSLLGAHVAVLDPDSTSPRVTAVHVDPIMAPALAFTDRNTAAVGGRDGQIQLWNLATGRPRSDPIPAIPGAVTALDVDARTRTVLASGNDGSVRLIDVGARSALGADPFQPNNTGVLALIDPARSRLLQMPAGAPPSVIDLNPTDWLHRACTLVSTPLDRDQWRRYLAARPYAPACAASH